MMMTNGMKVLVTESENISNRSKAILTKAGLKVTCMELDYAGLYKVIADFDIIVARLGIKVDRKMIDKAQKLKFIAVSTTGTDHIDTEYCANKHIRVISLRGERKFLDTITPTAELSFGLLLSLVRKINPSFDAVKDGEWDRKDWIGHDLKGMTIGIVGLGRLGTMMAKYAESFGMDVIYYDPHVSSRKFTRKRSIQDLVSSSDIVSLHLHLSDESRGMFSRKLFSKFRKGSFFINTSRGAIVDEPALLDALNRGILAGAALDVLANEVGCGTRIISPLIDYARKHSNLLITPHIGGATHEAMAATEDFIIEKLVREIKNE